MENFYFHLPISQTEEVDHRQYLPNLSDLNSLLWLLAYFLNSLRNFKYLEHAQFQHFNFFHYLLLLGFHYLENQSMEKVQGNATHLFLFRGFINDSHSNN
jgi:hypothetical protein